VNPVDPVLEIGESLIYGQIRVYPNRVEYHKRTKHASIPIGEASVSVEGFVSQTIKVYGKSQTFEVEHASMGDYEKLQTAISRLQAGEMLTSAQQVRREQAEENKQAVKELVQDREAQGCGLIVGVVFVVLVIIGLVVSAISWVVNAIGSLF